MTRQPPESQDDACRPFGFRLWAFGSGLSGLKAFGIKDLAALYTSSWDRPRAESPRAEAWSLTARRNDCVTRAGVGLSALGFRLSALGFRLWAFGFRLWGLPALGLWLWVALD